MRDALYDRTSRGQRRRRGRPPWWLVAVLLFVTVWLGVRIVDHVTDALTGAGIPAAPAAGPPNR